MLCIWSRYLNEPHINLYRMIVIFNRLLISSFAAEFEFAHVLRMIKYQLWNKKCDKSYIISDSVAYRYECRFSSIRVFQGQSFLVLKSSRQKKANYISMTLFWNLRITIKKINFKVTIVIRLTVLSSFQIDRVYLTLLYQDRTRRMSHQDKESATQRCFKVPIFRFLKRKEVRWRYLEIFSMIRYTMPFGSSSCGDRTKFRTFKEKFS